jgi:Chemotaxis protein histidine kinase and related kinases
MDQEKQRQITIYFIEEAKEHLDTIEHGLLNLKSMLTDPEAVNEVFRAAHSIKGGAAMLGYTGIQSLAHNFEDNSRYFASTKTSELISSCRPTFWKVLIS